MARAARCGIHLADQETAGGYVYYLLRAGAMSGLPLRREALERLPSVSASTLWALVDGEFGQRALAQYDYAFRGSAP